MVLEVQCFRDKKEGKGDWEEAQGAGCSCRVEAVV